MRLHVEIDHQPDGRWVGEIPSLPGVAVRGRTRAEAIAVAQDLALRILLDRWIHEGTPPRVPGI